jgi:hypothetical protein
LKRELQKMKGRIATEDREILRRELQKEEVMEG